MKQLSASQIALCSVEFKSNNHRKILQFNFVARVYECCCSGRIERETGAKIERCSKAVSRVN